ncbi:MAG: hypothetical protein AAFZ18_24970, partial [Myxococcota bacterium]
MTGRDLLSRARETVAGVSAAEVAKALDGPKAPAILDVREATRGHFVRLANIEDRRGLRAIEGIGHCGVGDPRYRLSSATEQVPAGHT